MEALDPVVPLPRVEPTMGPTQRVWLRERSSTPARLALIAALLVVGAVLFGVVATVAERSRARAAQGARTQAEPRLVQAGTVLGGAVVTESLFSWPGVGQLSISALSNRDYPLVLASVFVIAVGFSIINFLVDLLAAALDPRSRR